MLEKSEHEPDLPDTPDPSNFPLGSPESRAATRFLLEAGTHIKCCYIEPGPDGSPIECVPVRAKMEGGGLPDAEYVRLQGETAEAFEARVWSDLPIAAPLRVVSFFLADDPPDQAARVS